ncbi:MAG: Zn-dependent hydrolase [Gemmatimonadaceae bacterium]|nr:Zn-dependent hydrolase [Gemmatimonadaceae bacterium]
MNRRDFSLRLAGAVGALSLGGLPPAAAHARGRPQRPSVMVDGDRINRHLMELAEFGRNPYGGVSRVAYTEFDRQGREYVMGLMREAGLEVSIDVAGNIIGKRAGSSPALSPILFGSHIDSVPDGGNYDGDVGVLSSIEVARTLRARGHVTRHPIEVIVFQNEEGGTIGSRAFVGHLPDKDLDLVARSGKTLRDGIRFLGGDPSRLSTLHWKTGDYTAYVELHIEQGGTLDAERLDIGVVEGIVGIGWWDVTIDGFGNHAGTTPMDKRRDALLAAAKYVQMVNRVVTAEPGRQVGTVGKIQAFPGAPNVIPGQVQTTLEIRDLDKSKIVRLAQQVMDEARKIGAENGTTFTFRETYLSEPAMMNPAVQKVIEASATSLGLSTKYLPSGAGHDAQYMAQIMPTGMIFCPSVGGISHSPKEFTKPQDVVNGANVLLQTVLALDAK